MNKAKSKPKTAARSVSRKLGKPNFRKRPTAASSKPTARIGTEHDRIVAMLRLPAGATLASLVTATGWQPHSVRGFLAGVVRKKLGFNLVSEIGAKGRVYRIRDGKASTAAIGQARQVTG